MTEHGCRSGGEVVGTIAVTTLVAWYTLPMLRTHDTILLSVPPSCSLSVGWPCTRLPPAPCTTLSISLCTYTLCMDTYAYDTRIYVCLYYLCYLYCYLYYLAGPISPLLSASSGSVTLTRELSEVPSYLGRPQKYGPRTENREPRTENRDRAIY